MFPCIGINIIFWCSHPGGVFRTQIGLDFGVYLFTGKSIPLHSSLIAPGEYLVLRGTSVPDRTGQRHLPVSQDVSMSQGGCIITTLEAANTEKLPAVLPNKATRQGRRRGKLRPSPYIVSEANSFGPVTDNPQRNASVSNTSSGMILAILASGPKRSMRNFFI